MSSMKNLEKEINKIFYKNSSTQYISPLKILKDLHLGLKIASALWIEEIPDRVT